MPQPFKSLQYNTRLLSMARRPIVDGMSTAATGSVTGFLSNLEGEMNLPARSFPASRFRLACVYTASLVFLLAASTLISPPLYADSTSTSSIQICNFTMTSSSGTIVFLDLWTAEAFAQAQNSLGQNVSQFNSSLGGLAQANASVQYASAQSSADALNMILMGSTTVNIPGGLIAASAVSQQTLSNMFEITGAGGPVNVTFGVLLNSMQSLLTDSSGLFAGSEVAFTLSVDGQVVLFQDIANQIGPNGSWNYTFSGELTNTIPLYENQWYEITAFADQEVSGLAGGPGYHREGAPSKLVLLGWGFWFHVGVCPPRRARMSKSGRRARGI